jgi:hypothetical protein
MWGMFEGGAGVWLGMVGRINRDCMLYVGSCIFKNAQVAIDKIIAKLATQNQKQNYPLSDIFAPSCDFFGISFMKIN